MNYKDYAILARALNKHSHMKSFVYANVDERPGFSYLYKASPIEGRVALSEHEVLHLMKDHLVNLYGIVHVYLYGKQGTTVFIPSKDAARPGVWSGPTELDAFYGAFISIP